MSKMKFTSAELSRSVSEMLQGHERYLARLITLVESESEAVPEIMRLIHSRLGKSTLIEKLTKIARNKGHSVGIICVDPTSPFTGGAILGDRIRMDRHFLDDGVYIRSMATRGSLGGLASAVNNVAKLLDAFGKDIILVETVGVGQTEADILNIADLVLVVLVPEAGDAIQAMKAGLMEIADVFLVNKADRPGAEQAAADILAALHLRENNGAMEKTVLTAEAANDVGIDQLYEHIEKYRRITTENGQFYGRRAKQRRKEFLEIIERKIVGESLSLLEKDSALGDYLSDVESGAIEPYSASVEILQSNLLMEAWFKRFHKSK